MKNLQESKVFPNEINDIIEDFIYGTKNYYRNKLKNIFKTNTSRYNDWLAYRISQWMGPTEFHCKNSIWYYVTDENGHSFMIIDSSQWFYLFRFLTGP